MAMHTCARCGESFDRGEATRGQAASWCRPCRTEYGRAYYHAHGPPPRPPRPPRPRRTPEAQRAADVARLWSLINRGERWECWLFKGRARYGRRKLYGQTSLAGRPMSAHRAVWSITHGEPPEDMHVDHLCGVHLCCNPNHLRLLSPEDNGRDGARRARIFAMVRGANSVTPTA